MAGPVVVLAGMMPVLMHGLVAGLAAWHGWKRHCHSWQVASGGWPVSYHDIPRTVETFHGRLEHDPVKPGFSSMYV